MQWLSPERNTKQHTKYFRSHKKRWQFLSLYMVLTSNTVTAKYLIKIENHYDFHSLASNFSEIAQSDDGHEPY